MQILLKTSTKKVLISENATKTNKHTYGNMTYITYEPTEGLIVPEATYYCKMARMLSEFQNANRPTGSSPSAKMLEVKSASGTTKGITVKFKKITA